MASITVQDYDPALGVTVPPAVLAIGMEKPFREICARTEETWDRIRGAAPEAAAYILTNAHRRRVAMRVSARELYHLARVRADRHAQWDIRETAADDGRRRTEGHAAHAPARRGEGRLRCPLCPDLRRGKLTASINYHMNMETQKDPDGKHYPAVTGIGRDEHVGMVREIFATVTGRYDFLNHLLSLGRDIAWRRFAVRKMRFFNTFRFLDVATGTADLAIEAANGHPRIHVTGIDFVPGNARRRAGKK